VFFSFSFFLGGQIFVVFLAPFPEEEISDYLAQGSFIRVLTVGFKESQKAWCFAAIRSQSRTTTLKHIGVE